VSRKNDKAIGRYREVVENHFTGEGLMHVGAWIAGMPADQNSQNSENKFRLATPNTAKFRRAPTESVRDIVVEKFCSPEK